MLTCRVNDRRPHRYPGSNHRRTRYASRQQGRPSKGQRGCRWIIDWLINWLIGYLPVFQCLLGILYRIFQKRWSNTTRTMIQTCVGSIKNSYIIERGHKEHCSRGPSMSRVIHPQASDFSGAQWEVESFNPKDHPLSGSSKTQQFLQECLFSLWRSYTSLIKWRTTPLSQNRTHL